MKPALALPGGWRVSPAVFGALAGLCLFALFRLAPAEWRFVQQERVFDAILGAAAPLRATVTPPRPVFVDIDEASLNSVGRWPWKRETMAELVRMIADASPAVIALDLVFAGADSQSPAALARQLGADTGRRELTELAASLPDGDRALAAAMAGKPVVLGWILDPHGTDAPSSGPVILRGAAAPLALWRAAGVSAAGEALAAAAAGAGAISLPGDPDGVVRRVPLLVRAGADILPGFAAEVLRVHAGASAHVVSLTERRLEIGAQAWPLPRDGMLRLTPRPGSAAPLRISAATLLAGGHDRAAIAGSVVIIGASAAETGGLRAGIDDPLTPSSLLHAAAFSQLSAGIVPARPAFAGWVEAAAALLALAMAVAAAQTLRPFPASLAVLALIAALAALALAAAARDMLFNPAPAAAIAALGFATTLIGAFSQSRLREARLRRRFEQHLAPEVVRRIVANPGSLRLSGERRIVTALFTDIEGFTTTARDTDPERLIGVLDGYFEGVSRIIVEHGGMVDKFIGDAVHALFNLPFDTVGHQARAIACAKAIVDWTAAYRQTGEPLAIGLGRTRIGIETGEVVAGDVGVSTKLDYTAYGSAVNLAVRLEALNKVLGTTILIGPEAARTAQAPLRPLGRHEIRGFGPIEVFTVPEEAGTHAGERQRDGSEGGI